MSIIGVGIDVAETDRFEASLRRTARTGATAVPGEQGEKYTGAMRAGRRPPTRGP